MKSKQYYIYIITNIQNTVLYIGITSDLIKRIYQHKNKLIKGFSSKYNLVKLVYYEVIDTPQEAIKRERQLKNLVRRKKNKLIDEFNSEWKDLYEQICKWVSGKRKLRFYHFAFATFQNDSRLILSFHSIPLQNDELYVILEFCIAER